MPSVNQQQPLRLHCEEDILDVPSDPPHVKRARGAARRAAQASLMAAQVEARVRRYALPHDVELVMELPEGIPVNPLHKMKVELSPFSGERKLVLAVLDGPRRLTF